MTDTRGDPPGSGSRPYIYLLLLLCLISPRALSQLDKLDDSWRWSHFTTQTGLAANRILAIEETGDHRLWVATEKGLAWYDTFRWHTLDSSISVPYSQTLSLFKFGNHKIGIQSDYRIFIGDTTGFTEITPPPGKRDSIFNFASIQESDYLMMCTSDLYRIIDGTVHKITPPIKQISYSPSLAIRPGTNQIWVNTDKGIYSLVDERWHLQLPSRIGNFTSFHYRIQPDGDGIIAPTHGMAYGGLWEIKKGNVTSKIPIVITSQVQAIDLSSTGDVIVAFTTGSVLIRQNGHWKQITTLPPELKAIYTLKFDHQDNLWVGTEDGLFLFRASLNRWRNFLLPPSDRKNHVHEIFMTSDSAVWLGTRDGIIVHEHNGTYRFINEINGKKLNTVTGINQDSKGNIWVGSGASFTGAFRWDGKFWSHVQLPFTTEVNIHKIRKGRDGSLWFLCLDPDYTNPVQPGVYQYTDGKFITWDAKKDSLLGRVYAFAEDSSGGLWFGTYKGLYRWRNNTWTHWNDSTGLTISRTYALVADTSGRIWFSDEYSGLGYVDQDDIPRYYDESDGLLSDEVRDIQLDHLGRLWISTKLGLNLYDHGVWSSFGYKSGLSTLRLWENLPLKDKVYVGSDGGGLNILNLAEASPPPLIQCIEQPAIDNKQAWIRWNVYSHFGEQDQEDIQIRYRLDNTNWSEWTNQREKWLNNLSSGDHHFFIQAKSLFGKLTSENESIKFYIEQPIYLRTQFLLPVITLSGALALLMIAYSRRKRSHSKELQTSDERFHLVSRATNDTVYDTDLITNKVWFNTGLQATYGYTDAMQQLDCSWWRERIHQDDQPMVQEHLSKTFNSRGAFIQQEYRFKRSDGNYAFVLDRGYILYNEAGLPTRAIGSLMDISDRKKSEESLEHERILLRTLIEALPDEVALKDLDGRFQIVNRETVRVLNKEQPEEVLGKTDQDFIRPSLAEGHARDEQEILRTGLPIINRELTKIDASTGELIRCLLSTKVPFRDPSGKTVGLISINRDITGRKIVENQVQQRIDQLQALYQLADTVNRAQQVEVIWEAVFDTLNRILKTSRSMILLAGPDTTLAAVTDQNLSESFKEKISQWIAEHPAWYGPRIHLIDTIDHEQPLEELYPVLRAELIQSLGIIPLEHHGKNFGTLLIFYDTPHHFVADEVQLVQAVSYHVGFALERRRAETERDDLVTQLKHSHEQLRSVSRQLLEVQENERRIISRELHDQIGQALTALKLNLQMFQREFSSSGQSTPLTESIALIEKVLEQARTLSFNLHPSILHDLGLAPALRWYVDQNLHKHGITTHLNLQFEEQQMPEELKMICFRVFQEATTNIMRHAGATNVRLKLLQMDLNWIFSIQDNGRGFDVSKARSEALAGKSLGLLSMQERVELAGGEFYILSSQSEGTLIQLTLPIVVQLKRNEP